MPGDQPDPLLALVCVLLSDTQSNCVHSLFSKQYTHSNIPSRSHLLVSIAGWPGKCVFLVVDTDAWPHISSWLEVLYWRQSRCSISSSSSRHVAKSSSFYFLHLKDASGKHHPCTYEATLFLFDSCRGSHLCGREGVTCSPTTIFSVTFKSCDKRIGWPDWKWSELIFQLLRK